MGTVQRLVVLLLPLLLLAALQPAIASTNVTFPLPVHCQTSCGGIPVRYPFGFQDGCYRPGFKLLCNNSTQPPKLFLGDGTTQFMSDPNFNKNWIQNGYIFVEPLSQVVNVSSRSDGASATAKEVLWTAGAPYVLSSSFDTPMALGNTLTVVGCGVHASLVDSTNNVTFAGCTTTCDNREEMTDGVCAGIGCCQIQFLSDLSSYRIRVSVLNGTTQANSTGAVKIVAAYNGAYQFKPQDLYDTGAIRGDGLMAALKWRVPGSICLEAEKDASSYACLSDHSECQDRGIGYACACSDDDDGNAYVPHGCKGKCKLGICNKAVLGVVIAVIVVAVLLFLAGLVIVINRMCKK